MSLGLGDVVGVLDQGVGVDVALPHLALGSVVAEEPVVAEGLRVLLPRQPHHLGGLLLEPVELAVADLQSRFDLEHVSASFRVAPASGASFARRLSFLSDAMGASLRLRGGRDIGAPP